VGRYNGLVLVADALSENPLFGVGTERRIEAASQFAPEVPVATGHGEYQRYAVENGLTGLLLYVTAWAFIFFRAVRHSRAFLTEGRTYAAFIVGFVSYSIFVNLFMGGGGINIMFMSVSIGLITRFRRA
jgi:O-antigen ligase